MGIISSTHKAIFLLALVVSLLFGNTDSCLAKEPTAADIRQQFENASEQFHDVPESERTSIEDYIEQLEKLLDKIDAKFPKADPIEEDEPPKVPETELSAEQEPQDPTALPPESPPAMTPEGAEEILSLFDLYKAIEEELDTIYYLRYLIDLKNSR